MDSSEDKKIEEQINDLKVEIKSVHQLLAHAKQNIQLLEEYNSKFENIKVQIDAGIQQIEANRDSSITTKADIDRIKGASDESLNQIRTNLQSVETQVERISKAIVDFDNKKKEIDDPQTGIQAILIDSTSLKKEIEQVKNESVELLQNISKNLSTININIQEMTDFYNSFLEVKVKISDPTNGLEALLGAATNLKGQINQTKAAIDETFREILLIKKQSDELKNHIESDKQKVNEYRKTSEEYKNEIGKTLEIVTDSSLANSFKQRKNELNKETRMWLFALGTIISLLISYVLYILTHDFNFIPKDFISAVLLKLSFTSPFIFAIWFCSINYAKARDLLEKYAFKYAVSLSLQSYTKLLTDKFPENDFKDKLSEFAINSIEKVYKEPYLEKNKSRKMNFGIHQVFKVGLEESDLESVKQKAAKEIASDVRKG